AVHERRRDRGVDAARERAEDAAAADLRAHPLHRFADEGAGRPGWRAAADPQHEVADHLPPVRRVDDLGMELDADDALVVGEGRHRRVAAAAQGPESGRQPQHLVSVVHPHRQLAGQPVEESARLLDPEQGRAVLAAGGRRDLAAQVVSDQLHAVADAEHRDARAQRLGVDLGCARLVNAGGPAREDQARRPALGQLGPGRGAGDDLAVHARFAHAAGDQLTGLGPEIEDEDGLALLLGRSRRGCGRSAQGTLGQGPILFFRPEMAMKTLEYLRGITAEECTRLRDRGIRHSNQLLHACTLHFDRDRISRKTGISTERLLYFAHECALLEISGMERFLPVLRRFGVTDLKILKKQDPADLQARLQEVIGVGTPTLPMVQYWVSQARTCDMIEEYEPAASETSPSLLSQKVR